MRFEPADKELFIHNRKNLTETMLPNSIAVVHSNDVFPSNADALMPFKQNTDFYYLTGIDQEESVLILFPDAKEERNREILFVLETNEHLAIWEGEKLSKEKATTLSGIQRVEWVDSFDTVLQQMAHLAENIYMTSNDHPRNAAKVQTRNDRLIPEYKERFPLHQFKALAPLIHKLRATKHPLEVEKIQHACDITEKGFRRVLGFIKPDVGEWEIEAEFIHEFTRNNSKGFAYTPIIGSGFNACVLHYIDNNNIVKDGEVILMDVAAEYANWNADMTRAVPVNGKFTGRQRAVYNAVLRALRYADSILRPGVQPKDYQQKMLEFMEGELIDLGLINAEEAKKQDESKPLVKKYFMHGTSHHLGLDIHDVCPPDTPFEVGQVLTIEPGIYIREENLGIRLENNFLIGEKNNTDLMANIPIEADEIEALMAQS